jgi:hypothetical protein
MSSTRFQRVPKGSMQLVPGIETRSRVQLTNRVQTAAILFRLAYTLTVAGAVANVTRRTSGRLSDAILLTPINENGTDMVGEIGMRDFRLMGEAEAGQAFPAELLPAGANAVVDGVYNCVEYVQVNFADPRNVGPSETNYMEADPNSPVWSEARFAAGTATLLATLVNSTGAAVLTLSNVSIEVEQFLDSAATKLPLFTKRIRYIASDVIVGANPEAIYRLPTRQRVASLLFRQQDIGVGYFPLNLAFNALRLIGDDGRNVIGPTQARWESLVDGQAANQGGEIVRDAYFHDFATFGRMSGTPIPDREYPNFRAEVNQDTGGATGTARGLITITELIARAPVNGYATVMPRVLADGQPNPEFPSWAL